MREAAHQLYIATMLTFRGTGAVKIFENSKNRALLSVMQSELVQPPPAPPSTGRPAPPPGGVPDQPSPGRPPSRAERRAAERATRGKRG